MSFRRTLVALIATLGLTTVAFATDDNNLTAQGKNGSKAIQLADASTTTTTTEETYTTTTEEVTKIDLNKASARELMKIKGVNAAKAKAIISYRKKHGEFKSLDELRMVKGFRKLNENTFKKIQDQLTIG